MTVIPWRASLTRCGLLAAGAGLALVGCGSSASNDPGLPPARPLIRDVANLRITAGAVPLRIPAPAGWGVADLGGPDGRQLALVRRAGPCYLSISILYAYVQATSTGALVAALDPTNWEVTRLGGNALAEIDTYTFPGSSGRDALLGDAFLSITPTRSAVVQYAGGIWPYADADCGSPEVAGRAPTLRAAIAGAMLAAHVAAPTRGEREPLPQPQPGEATSPFAASPTTSPAPSPTGRP